MNKLKAKLFEYGGFGRIVWYFLLANVVCFVLSLAWNLICAIWGLITMLFAGKKARTVNTEIPWED